MTSRRETSISNDLAYASALGAGKRVWCADYEGEVKTIAGYRCPECGATDHPLADDIYRAERVFDYAVDV